MHRTTLSRLGAPSFAYPSCSAPAAAIRSAARTSSSLPLVRPHTTSLDPTADRRSLMLSCCQHGHGQQSGYSTSSAPQPLKQHHHGSTLEAGSIAASSPSQSMAPPRTHTPHTSASATSPSPLPSERVAPSTSPNGSTAPSIASTTNAPSVRSPPPTSSTPKSMSKKAAHEWTRELNALMLTLHQEHHVNWRTIGKLLNRPHTTCYTHYSVNILPALKQGWFPPRVQDQKQLEQFIQQAQQIMQSNKTALLSATRARRGNTSEEEAAAEKPKRATWDEATDQRIGEMVLEGRSWPAIGAELNRPYASCYSRYYSTLDPALREPWTLEIVERVEEWVRQGVCWKKIAKDLDMRPISCKSKWAALKRLDIAPVTATTAIAADSNTELPTPALKTSTANNGRIKWNAFSNEESISILELVEKHGSENWDQVLKDFQERSFHHVMSRSTRRLLPNERQRIQQRIMGITPLDLSHQFSRLARTKFHWTFDQETILIQQVLKYGAEGTHWEKIAAQLTGIHTPEECRSHWKQLDMPVCPNTVKWTKIEQSTFWDLWREFGSDFNRLSRLSGGQHSPTDCKQYFETTTSDFPDHAKEPELFEKRVEDFQATLPMSRQKYVFTKERSLRLQRAMKYYGKQIDRSWAVIATWNWVANRVQRGLSAVACMDHWAYLRRNMDVLYGPVEEGKSAVKPTVPNFWSHEELKLLDQGVRAMGASWNDIQEQFLPWRTPRSIRQRWLLMSDKSTKVTEDEYYTIIAAGDNTGDIDYDALIQKMPGWNRSPCRRIFETSYKHLMATTVWLPEEDRLLVEKVLELKGRDWRAIARRFDGIQAARAPLYSEAMARLKAEGEDDSTPVRTQKTAWQCRLRWCQLVEPLMPKKWTWSVGSGSRALRLSKQLLEDTTTSKDTTTL